MTLAVSKTIYGVQFIIQIEKFKHNFLHKLFLKFIYIAYENVKHKTTDVHVFQKLFNYKNCPHLDKLNCRYFLCEYPLPFYIYIK